MRETVDFIGRRLADHDFSPRIGIVLGSGLGSIAEEIEGISIPYSEISGFPVSTVKGHAGKLVTGKLCSKTVIAMQGRFHFYEGYPMETVIFPIRVMKQLGIEILIVTNAAGGINLDFKPGDLMVIKDHINLMGNNPLIGKNLDESALRFVDMSFAYDGDLIELAENTAKNLDLKLKKGIYAAMTGPMYETPAEIRMLRILGADAVGMSTVPEVIAAKHLGLKVLGISCITNMAAGILDKPLSHNEMIETSNRVKDDFSRLVRTVIESLP